MRLAARLKRLETLAAISGKSKQHQQAEAERNFLSGLTDEELDALYRKHFPEEAERAPHTQEEKLRNVASPASPSSL